MFVITSIFLLCCELYGWTYSDKAQTEGLSRKEKAENEKDSVGDNFVRESDFPTLAEWLDDREVLYQERSRYGN